MTNLLSAHRSPRCLDLKKMIAPIDRVDLTATTMMSAVEEVINVMELKVLKGNSLKNEEKETLEIINQKPICSLIIVTTVIFQLNLVF